MVLEEGVVCAGDLVEVGGIWCKEMLWKARGWEGCVGVMWRRERGSLKAVVASWSWVGVRSKMMFLNLVSVGCGTCHKVHDHSCGDPTMGKEELRTVLIDNEKENRRN